VRFNVTPVVLSGSISSYMRPPLAPPPPSSPKRTVPQGVLRTGSHEVVPVTMVYARPSERRMRWTPACATPSSLQAMRWVGLWSLGQRTIWSMLGAAVAVTTLA